MTPLFVFVLALVGFATVALSMRRHQHVAPNLVRYRPFLRNGGFVLLLGSLAVSMAQPRTSIAFVEWVFLLTTAGIPVVAAMTLLSPPGKNKNAR